MTCNIEAPSVESAYQKYSDNVTVIGVAWNGSAESMNDFVTRHGISFNNISDNDGNIFAQFGVPVQPAWVFIKQAGDATTHVGALDEVSLEQELRQLSES